MHLQQIPQFTDEAIYHDEHLSWMFNVVSSFLSILSRLTHTNMEIYFYFKVRQIMVCILIKYSSTFLKLKWDNALYMHVRYF